MDLNKNNIKKIIFIIAVGILIYTAVGHVDMVYGGIKWVVALLFPFLLGMSMAFILNVPMRSIENGLFGNYRGKFPKLIKKIRRPVSFTDAYFYFRYYLHCYPVYSSAARNNLPDDY